jgi:hypothetical protein
MGLGMRGGGSSVSERETIDVSIDVMWHDMRREKREAGYTVHNNTSISTYFDDSRSGFAVNVQNDWYMIA